MWNEWLPLISAGDAEILCPDLPGFGNNAHLKVPGSMEGMARWMAFWLDERGIEQVIWIGHSMGGYAGAAFARCFPERIKALIMFHSTFRADGADKIEKRKKTIAFVQEHGPEPFLKQFVPMLFHKEKNIPQAWLEMASELVKTTKSESIISATEAMMMREDHSSWLTQAELPICLIAGKGDAHIPYPDIIEQAALIKRGSLIMLENSGHLGMKEEPGSSADAVNSFLRLFL